MSVKMMKSLARLTKLAYPCQNVNILQQQLKTFSDVANESDTVKRTVSSIEKSFNQVILVGRVGNDPERRGTENTVVTFSLATNHYYVKDEERVQQTEWHRIAIFRPQLKEKTMQFLSKGRRVMVIGKLSYMERKDPSSSILVKIASVVADDIMFFAS